MKEEYRLESNTRYGSKTVDFIFTPRDKKYNELHLTYWCSYNRPIKYEPINKTDCLLYFKGQIIPKLFPLKYIEPLEDYMINHMRGNGYTDMKLTKLPERKEQKDTITVGKLLRDIDIDHLRIGYRNSRTILNAYSREALAYAQAFSGIVVFFKKRGGYLCYHISRVGIGHRWGWNNATQIRDLMQGVELLKDIRKRKLAVNIKIPKGFEQKMLDETLINNI